MDILDAFKAAQREGWQHFAPVENLTTPAAARLVAYARVRAGQRLLDVACGTGVVAITAARRGARVTGLDLTPDLLERARDNAELARTEIAWRQGDVEALPFPEDEFDVVLSQFGHMFAPRPEVAIAEMLRVLKPGGTIAFSTWPPELFTGRMFRLIAAYAPPLPAGVAPPLPWGDPKIVSERLAGAVRNVTFDCATLWVPAMSIPHYRTVFEKTVGPVIKLVESLSASDPEKLGAFRSEYEKLVEEYYDQNLIRQDYLLTRGEKV